MTNEEFVRSVWENVRESEYDPHEGYTIPQTRVDFGQYNRTEIKAKDAWSAAVEFTRERLEEVRQLREEIRSLSCDRGQLLFDIGIKVKFGSDDAADACVTGLWVRDLCAKARTGQRLESELSRLTQGMKEPQPLGSLIDTEAL